LREREEGEARRREQVLGLQTQLQRMQEELEEARKEAEGLEGIRLRLATAESERDSAVQEKGRRPRL